MLFCLDIQKMKHAKGITWITPNHHQRFSLQWHHPALGTHRGVPMFFVGEWDVLHVEVPTKVGGPELLASGNQLASVTCPKKNNHVQYTQYKSCSLQVNIPCISDDFGMISDDLHHAFSTRRDRVGGHRSWRFCREVMSSWWVELEDIWKTSCHTTVLSVSQ